MENRFRILTQQFISAKFTHGVQNSTRQNSLWHPMIASCNHWIPERILARGTHLLQQAFTNLRIHDDSVSPVIDSLEFGEDDHKEGYLRNRG